MDRPVVLTRAAHNSDTWRGRPQSTPAPSALQCDSRTQSNGRSVVARSCPLRLVLLFVEPMQATRMSSKDASSVGRPSARSHASLLAHHLKRCAYTPGEGTSFGSLFDGVGENDGRCFSGPPLANALAFAASLHATAVLISSTQASVNCGSSALWLVALTMRMLRAAAQSARKLTMSVTSIISRSPSTRATLYAGGA